MNPARLVVVETHPVQYHAPVYRLAQQEFNVPVTVIYGSDFSVAGYHDAEFGAAFKWDTDLLSGYDARFLATVAKGGGRAAGAVTTRGLGAALRAIRPAAILLLGYSPRFYQTAFWTSWRGGAPLLFRGETNEQARARSGVKQLVRAAALRKFYARFAALLYIGELSRAHFRQMGAPDARLVFSPYCVDTAPFQLDDTARAELRAQTRRALGLAETQRVILFSGKLAPRKAPDVLVNAVKQLPDAQRDNLTLLWLGDGALRESLARAGETAPRVDMRFVGFQNQTALSRFYHASDVLALPSRASETWGLVVNEALHHGLPCIVSDRVGCAPDLIEPGVTGEIFPADDAAALAHALARILSRSERDAMRAACLERISHYSARRAAQGIAEAYAFVAQKAKTRDR